MCLLIEEYKNTLWMKKNEKENHKQTKYKNLKKKRIPYEVASPKRIQSKTDQDFRSN